jgi:anaerobic selenocysteine-containing dehydrogenase
MSLLRRREFLLASSAAAGAVLFSGCVPPPREMEGESRVLLAEDLLSAYDNWYATTCRGCAAGCGVVVRVVDGRARKVEGNPEHPLNRGKLCARGQAIVQEQYHPDRVRGPLQRSAAERGGGAFQSVSWSVALDALTAQLATLRDNGHAGDVTLITPPLDAHEAFLVERFATSYGLKWLSFEATSEAPLREAVRRVFGFDRLPRFDVANARTVLSFGADFLGGWLSPVGFGLAYGMFRQGNYDSRAFQPRDKSRPRGHLIHVDTHFSTTAASADEWVWVQPGAEGLLALSIAQALAAAGYDAYTPEQMAPATGVSADRTRRIANQLRDNGPSLVLGGGQAGAYTHGTEALAAILSLNTVLNTVGQPGGVLPPAPALPAVPGRSASASVADWQDLVARMNDGREQVVLIAGGADPVHGLPDGIGFLSGLLRVPLVVSFGSFMDDTTTHADLVLPSSLGLEQWGDAAPEVAQVQALSMQQPVVDALFDTRSVWDVLLAVADDLGGGLRDALPWPTFKDLLQVQLGQLPQADSPSALAWNQILQHGGFWPDQGQGLSRGGPLAPRENSPSGGNAAITGVSEPQFAGDPQTYRYWLVPFAHNTLGAGESAHLPWLQATPDPVTSVTWQTWVALNPKLAAQLAVSEGDIVAVESVRGRVEVPVYVSPAAPPQVVAMPFGQGHIGGGRWAVGRGANPMQLLEPLADAATGALAYASTRVRLSKTGRSSPVPKLEGIAPARQLPGQEVLKVIRA